MTGVFGPVANFETLFKGQGFEKEFEMFREDLQKVKQFYDEAVREQGNHGRLIIVSMPKAIASKISYCAKPGGLIN